MELPGEYAWQLFSIFTMRYVGQLSPHFGNHAQPHSLFPHLEIEIIKALTPLKAFVITTPR
jgi:hypothetical protein